jgi:hypothetical protein
MEEIKFTAEKLHFINFEVQSASIESPPKFRIDEVVNHEFTVSFNIGFDLEAAILRADLTIEVVTESDGKNEKEANGSFHLVAYYTIENLKELVRINGDSYDVDGIMATNIAAITFSTARGIIYTRFQGTALRNFILPIVDPKSMLESSKE